MHAAGREIMLFAQTSDKERIEFSGASICVGERSLLGSYSASVEYTGGIRATWFSAGNCLLTC